MRAATPSSPHALVLAALLLCSRPAFSQSLPVDLKDYDRAVAAYIEGGDMTSAVAPFERWKRRDFEDAIRGLILTKDTPRIEAAAVFQLEAGIGSSVTSAAAAGGHFALGEMLLKGLLLPASEHNRARNQEVRELTASWYGVAASAYLSLTDVARAQLWLRKALDLAPHSPTLRTLQGHAMELEACANAPDRVETIPQQAQARIRYRFLLASAGGAYAAAIERDPSNAVAHIRAGRALFLLGDLNGARESIQRGRALAAEPSHRYLAELFLGAVFEQLHDLEAARSSYERALKIAPISQTATIALAHLELVNGRPDRANALAQAFAAATTDDKDWWAYKNGGLDEPGLASLRKRVRRGRIQ